MNLLLPVLVLAWSLLPPAVRHAHVGGDDTTHRHGDASKVTRSAAHQHHGQGARHQHATVPDARLLAEFAAHVHWRLFGLEFSLPVPETPAEGDHGQSVPPATIVRVVDDVVPAAPVGPLVTRAFAAVTGTPPGQGIAHLVPVPRARNFSRSLPLCDSARRARSGVLLS